MRKVLQKIASSSSSSSIAARQRKKRFKLFLEMLPSEKSVTILDIGGWIRFWEIQNFTSTDNKIIILNLNLFKSNYPNITSIIGDARNLSNFKDKEIDIVFSNSVIEHVGTREDQIKMAKEIRRVAKNYYIQTPSFYFPLEPHFLFPFFHWLPIFIRIFLVQHFSLGWYKKINSKNEAAKVVNGIRLLRKSELMKFFPESVIHKEKFYGLTKSYVIIKNQKGL